MKPTNLMRLIRSMGPTTALIFVLSGCSVLGIDQPADDLKERQKRWQALGIDDYSFEFQRSCFCGGPHGFLRVVVTNDRVVTVVDAQTGIPPQNLMSGWVGTVDEIFAELIDDAEKAHELKVSFDSVLHYPTQAQVDRIKNAIDDEYGITLRNLRRTT